MKFKRIKESSVEYSTCLYSPKDAFIALIGAKYL